MVLQFLGWIYKIGDKVFAGVLGFTILDIPFIGGSILDGIDDSIKTAMAFIGLVYFILKGIHNFKMNALEVQEKKISNRMKEEELEGMEIENDKKTKS